MRGTQTVRWPGNVRELQNLIERSVILTSGTSLRIPLANCPRYSWSDTNQNPVTLEDAERAHIMKTLEQTQGVIGGRNGAATRLGMKRSSLYFRMRKLGIPTRSPFR
jgi:formate hydrogenlyase transcriptional activator